MQSGEGLSRYTENRAPLLLYVSREAISSNQDYIVITKEKGLGDEVGKQSESPPHYASGLRGARYEIDLYSG